MKIFIELEVDITNEDLSTEEKTLELVGLLSGFVPNEINLTFIDEPITVHTMNVHLFNKENETD